MAKLGEDGLGFELASRLQTQGVWRTWLGEQGFTSLQPHLASAAAWASFMRPSSSSSSSAEQQKNVLLPLQMRVRALLFDRALASIFLDSSPPAAALDSSYMQLYADNVYFSLEQDITDWSRLQAEGSPLISSLQVKFGPDLISHDLSNSEDGEDCASVAIADNRQKKLIKVTKQTGMPSIKPQGQKMKRSQSSLNVEWSDTSFGKLTDNSLGSGEASSANMDEDESWYQKWFEKSLPERMHRLAWRTHQRRIPFKDRESFQRTPQGMASYLSVLKKIQKRRRVEKHDWQQSGALIRESGSKEVIVLEESPRESALSVGDEDFNFFPEVTYPWNSVPDKPVPSTAALWADYSGAGSSMQERSHDVFSKSPLLLSSMKASLGLGLGRQQLLHGAFNRGSVDQNGKGISDEQASHLLKQVIVQVVASAGFQGLKQGAMEGLSRLFTCHIQKLGSTLRMLSDNYQSHCSEKEILKMFIRSSGCRDLGAILQCVKAQQQIPSRTNHVQPPSQLQAAQVNSSMKQAMQPMHPQHIKLSNVQQLQQLRQRQLASMHKGSMVGGNNKERLAGDMKPDMDSFGPTEAKSMLQNMSLVQPQQISSWQPQSQSQQQQQQQQQLQLQQHQQQMMHSPSVQHSYTMQQMKQLSSSPLAPSPQQLLLVRDNVPTKMPHVKLEGLHELVGIDGNVKQESEEDKESLIGSPTRRRRL